MKIFKLICLQLLLAPPLWAQWKTLPVGTEASFRSLMVVNKKIIWAGGSGGTVIRSIDGGNSWQVFRIGEEQLDFRGIAAQNAREALVVSAGLAEEGLARIYKTIDGGATWYQVFNTAEPGVFLDGIHFIDATHGFVFGDPLEAKAYVLETFDSGESWVRMPISIFPELRPGEASFAASNSGMVSQGGKIWYALQGRILISENRGKSWQIQETGFPSGVTNGIFGLFFWSKTEGILLGGDYKNDKAEQTNIALTTDGASTWKLHAIAPAGLKESAARAGSLLVAVGPSGTAVSTNGAKTWTPAGSEGFHVVRCKSNRCFAVGANGIVAKAKARNLKKRR